MSIEHLAVKISLRRNYRSKMLCPVCGAVISTCKPFRQKPERTPAIEFLEESFEKMQRALGGEANGEEKGSEEKTSEETAEERQ